MKQKMINRSLPFVCLVLAVTTFFLLRGLQSKNDVSVPDEVLAVVDDYMEAYKEGVEVSSQYMHFEDEFIKSAYIAAGDRLIDYQIERIEKVNENLYAFTMLMKSEQTPFYSEEEYECVYNFVGKIDGKWWYINGIAHIPTDIQKGLDASKYVYQDEDIVAHGDVLH